MRGFTLIELIVVFAIFFIVTAVGMVSFNQYNTVQELESVSADIASLLNSARVNAVTQTMQNLCTQQLLRYSIKITPPSTYAMIVYCNGTSFSLKNNTLPASIIFDTGTSSEISFLVASGLSSGGTVKLKGASKTKLIQIDTAGNTTEQ